METFINPVSILLDHDCNGVMQLESEVNDEQIIPSVEHTNPLKIISRNQLNLLGIFANYTNNIIKYNVCLNNISFLKKYLTNIIIVDSDSEEYSKKLYDYINKDVNNYKISNYFLINNNVDYAKWIYALNNINYEDYDYILFINDSIIITESLEEYFYSLNNISHNINLYAFSDSIEYTYHYESYLFFINKNIINNFINFFNTKKNLVYDYESYFYNIQLKIIELDNNKDCFLKINNFSENTLDMKEVVDMRYGSGNDGLSRTRIHSDLIIPSNNNNKYILILRLIFEFHKNYKETIYGNNFNLLNYSFYKNNYDDLQNLNEDELFNHFITIGQFEGRKYNNKIKTLLPEDYKKKLENIGLLSYFDVPETFDIFLYKKNNKEIDTLSNIDVIFYFFNMYFYKDSNKLDEIIYDNNINRENQKNQKNQKNSTDFNSNIYKFINKDIFHFNHEIISSYNTHKTFDNSNSSFFNCIESEEDKNLYIKYKINKLPKDFNPTIYKLIYKDLSHFNNEEATNHYLEYGFHELRIYKLPDDFDATVYKLIYKDLSHLSNKEAITHYLEYGFHELRNYKLPDDFDVNSYKLIYKDLSHLSDEEAITHYLEYGFHELRNYKLSNDFNTSCVDPELSESESETSLLEHG
jgi:hypothetical protein